MVEAARQQHEVSGVAVDSAVQPPLPFSLPRLANGVTTLRLAYPIGL